MPGTLNNSLYFSVIAVITDDCVPISCLKACRTRIIYSFPCTYGKQGSRTTHKTASGLAAITRNSNLRSKLDCSGQVVRRNNVRVVRVLSLQ